MTVVRTPHRRSGAIHHLAVATVRRTDGPAYWVDARNTASTYALYEHAAADRVLERLHLARAFTAYQHRTLVDRVLNRANRETGCLVAPNVAALYRDEDVPDHEAEPLFDAAMATLADVAETVEGPVLVTDSGPDDALADTLRAHANAEIRCERTDLGYRYEGPDFETDVYWGAGFWQTTIPYWVALLGTVDEEPDRALTGPALRQVVEG